MFANRTDAGRKLAARLPRLDGEVVVLALPRGGVPVAAEVCRAHGWPLDLVFVRKIGAPGHAELAMGAVVDGDAPQVVVNDDVARSCGVSREEVLQLGHAKLPEIAARRATYLAGRPSIPLEGKTVVVIDDGVATGASLRAALKAVRGAHPAKLVVALPVAPADAMPMLRAAADEVVCLETPAPFWAVGAHYADFPQTSDAEVRRLVGELAPPQAE